MIPGDVISLTGVTLLRRLPTAAGAGEDLKRRLFDIARGKYQRTPRRAVLEQIDLRIRHGEKIGVIGPNGSGKSTLLRVICGILRPTVGSVQVRGTIAPLLELGAGFDPDLSVRDNVFLYAALLGYGKSEIREEYDRIIEFAELEEYPNAPVRALSSGMTARLGFAIATAFAPDILLFDEIFAVGDERFRAKSRRRIEELWRGDRTIVLVSHDLASIRQTCERAIWLENGKVRALGDANAVVNEYTLDVDNRARAVLQAISIS